MIETMSRSGMVQTILDRHDEVFGVGLTHPKRHDLPFVKVLDPSRFFHTQLADAGGDSA